MEKDAVTEPGKVRPQLFKFQNLSIRNKIYSGFAVVVALLFVIGGFSVIAAREFSNGFDTYARVSDNSVIVARIDRSVVGLRRNFQQFRATGDKALAERFAELYEQTTTNLQLVKASTNNPERIERLDYIQERLSSYNEQFLVYVEGFNDFKKIRDKKLLPVGTETRRLISAINKAGDKENDYLLKSIAGEAQEALMLSRLNTARFLADPKISIRTKASTQLTVLDKFLDEIEARVSDRPKILSQVKLVNDLATVYGKFFNQMSDQALQLDKIGDELAQTAEEISEAARVVRNNQLNRLAELEEQTQSSIDQSSILTITIAAFALLVALIVAYISARSLVNPVTALTETMEALSTGERNVDVPNADRDDEIGMMARATQTFKDGLIEQERMQKLEAERQKSEAERAAKLQARTAEFDNDIKALLNRLESSSKTLHSTSDDLNVSSEKTDQLATDVASATEEMSVNVQSVVSSVEQMDHSIREISQQISTSSSIASEASERANETDAIVGTLFNNVSRVEQVVKIINSIAEQTNLLALNATIESARAGEAGKGFAVVAKEVKSLANETSKSTEEIGQQIEDIQSSTKEVVDSMKLISQTIDKVKNTSVTISAAVEEQAASTQEINRSVGEASSGVESVSKSIIHVSEAASKTGASSTTVRDASTNVASVSVEVRECVELFLADANKLK